VTTLASAALTPAGVTSVSRVVRLVVPTRSTSIRTCSRRSAGRISARRSISTRATT
jgi:hypothetical protein